MAFAHSIHARGTIMIERRLGRSGPMVSAIGLGCMGMSEFYDPKQMDDQESIRVIHRYLDAGGNFLDTADMYGVGVADWGISCSRTRRPPGHSEWGQGRSFSQPMTGA